MAAARAGRPAARRPADEWVARFVGYTSVHPRLVTVEPGETQAVGDVAGHVTVREEHAVLEHQAESPAVYRDRGKVRAVPADAARRNGFQACDGAQQG